MSLRDKLKDYKVVDTEVYIEELDETVTVRPLSLGEFLEFGNKWKDADNVSQMEISLAMFLHCCVNKDGERDYDPDDLELLKKLPQAVSVKLVQISNKVNQFGRMDDVEDRAKN